MVSELEMNGDVGGLYIYAVIFPKRTQLHQVTGSAHWYTNALQVIIIKNWPHQKLVLRVNVGPRVIRMLFSYI